TPLAPPSALRYSDRSGRDSPDCPPVGPTAESRYPPSGTDWGPIVRPQPHSGRPRPDRSVGSAAVPTYDSLMAVDPQKLRIEIYPAPALRERAREVEEVTPEV